MCDHTEEERGGSFYEALPPLPTLGHLVEKQERDCPRCGTFLRKWNEMIYHHGQLICARCWHKIDPITRLGDLGRTLADGGEAMSQVTSNSLASIKTPHLSDQERGQLMEALNDHLRGKHVELAVRYESTHENYEPSVPDKDYRARLAHGADVLEGKVVDIAKGEHGWYIRIDASITRQPLDEDGKPTTETAYRSIKGEGVLELLGVRVTGRTLPPAQ